MPAPANPELAPVNTGTNLTLPEIDNDLRALLALFAAYERVLVALTSTEPCLRW